MNINAFLALIFNMTSLITLVLLFLTVFIIMRLFNQTGYGLKFIPYNLGIFFFIYFLFIGTAVYLFNSNELHPKTSLIKIYRHYSSSILIISASYFGAIYIVYKKGVGFLLKVIFSMFLFTSFMTVIGPYIGLVNIYENISRSIEVGDRDSLYNTNDAEEV